MTSNPLEFYSAWELEESIDRLENLRCGLGFGDLSDDLELAIECMECLIEAARERDDE